MSKNGFSVEQLKAAIKEKNAKWTPRETSITRLTATEQTTRLGLRPTETELKLVEEFNLDKPDIKTHKVEFKILHAAGAPTKMDWRNVSSQNYTTPIRDQDSCGSCVAFGTIAALEALVKIKVAGSGASPDYSEAHLLFCGGGSCGGWHMDAACNYLQGNGVPDEACFPYAQGLAKKTCATCADWKSRIGPTQIQGWDNTKDITQMKTYISENGPQITGMAVYNDFFSYAGGVYEHVSGDLAGYHCVSVVGYDDSAGCWICKNSWGTDWGESGWFRIKYGQCGIQDVFGMWNMTLKPAAKSEGWAQHILVDYSFAGARTLWAYAEGAWRYKPLTDAEVASIAKLVMEAGKVYVWWNTSNVLTMVRTWK